jgi:hypothetical protein
VATLVEIYDGGSRPDAARIGGVGVQIVRDWVVRFYANFGIGVRRQSFLAGRGLK